MNIAAPVRYMDLQKGSAFDLRQYITHDFYLMARKFGFGLITVMTEQAIEAAIVSKKSMRRIIIKNLLLLALVQICSFEILSAHAEDDAQRQRREEQRRASARDHRQGLTCLGQDVDRNHNM